MNRKIIGLIPVSSIPKNAIPIRIGSINELPITKEEYNSFCRTRFTEIANVFEIANTLISLKSLVVKREKIMILEEQYDYAKRFIQENCPTDSSGLDNIIEEISRNINQLKSGWDLDKEKCRRELETLDLSYFSLERQYYISQIIKNLS